MKQYPIWNLINSCIYKSGKSYGVREHGDVTVLVGTSSRNSHKFLDHRVTHRTHENGDREYRFSVDGKLIKRAVLRKGASELTFLDVGQTAEIEPGEIIAEKQFKDNWGYNI